MDAPWRDTVRVYCRTHHAFGAKIRPVLRCQACGGMEVSMNVGCYASWPATLAEVLEVTAFCFGKCAPGVLPVWGSDGVLHTPPTSNRFDLLLYCGDSKCRFSLQSQLTDVVIPLDLPAAEKSDRMLKLLESLPVARQPTVLSFELPDGVRCTVSELQCDGTLGGALEHIRSGWRGWWGDLLPVVCGQVAPLSTRFFALLDVAVVRVTPKLARATVYRCTTDPGVIYDLKVDTLLTPPVAILECIDEEAPRRLTTRKYTGFQQLWGFPEECAVILRFAGEAQEFTVFMDGKTFSVASWKVDKATGKLLFSAGGEPAAAGAGAADEASADVDADTAFPPLTWCGHAGACSPCVPRVRCPTCKAYAVIITQGSVTGCANDLADLRLYCFGECQQAPGSLHPAELVFLCGGKGCPDRKARKPLRVADAPLGDRDALKALLVDLASAKCSV